ncbi:MAG: hypothetical protein K2L19_08270 [Eubacterium sp.]|nr:hypothetical protein [Eubacterium sp.]
MKKAASLAVCGIITALSVVLLFFGGIAFVLAYIMPMLVGLFAIMLKRTFGAASAWITYAATSVLSFILVADKECMLMYVMFFGFYPIIHDSLNKIRITPLRATVKLMIFNITVSAAQLLLLYVFGIPFLEEGEGKWLIILFAVLMNILFIMYDRILVALTKLYEIKLEKKIKKFFK